MKNNTPFPLDDSMVMYLDTPEMESIQVSNKVTQLKQPTQFTDATHFIITTTTTTTRKYLVKGRNALNAVDTLCDPKYMSTNLSKQDTHPDVRIEPIPDDFTLDDLKIRYPEFS